MNRMLQQIKDELGLSNAEDLDAEDLEMLEMADHFDSLDAEEFAEMLDDAEEREDYLDFLEMVEDAERRRGVRRPMARKGGRTGFRGALPTKTAVRKAGRGKMSLPKPARGAHKQASNQALKSVGGGGSFPTVPGNQQGSFVANLMSQSRGDLNITVKREGAALAYDLPYILFGLNGFNSSFISTMRNYLPTGVTMVASADPNTGDMLLTYTDGIGTDVIRVTLTGSQISYMEFLENMNSNFFKTKYIRQEYPNNANLLNAVSQTINFGLLSALGARSANNLLPRSRRQTSDYQSFIINLFMDEQKITSDFSFVQKFTQVKDSIAWDVVMSDRVNLNNMS